MNLGKHCIVSDLLVQRNLKLSKDAHIHIPSSSTNDHDHQFGTNHSVFYAKYALKLPIDKFTVTNGSNKCKITFVDDHHFDATISDIKMSLSNSKVSLTTDSGANHGLLPDEFQGKVDIDTWSNALSTKELEYELSQNATATGDITVGSGLGVVLIYKYLDMAGPGTNWQIKIDTAPGALHS